MKTKKNSLRTYMEIELELDDSTVRNLVKYAEKNYTEEQKLKDMLSFAVEDLLRKYLDKPSKNRFGDTRDAHPDLFPEEEKK